MNTAQTDERDLAFIEPTTKVGGLSLRPFSAGTLTLCRALNLSLVTGGATPSAEDQQRQLVTLLFIQSQPLETIKSAVKVARKDYQAFLDDYILPLELELNVKELPKIIGELNSVLQAVAAAEFDVPPSGGQRDPNS
jgi:hypothetical protein